MTSLLRETQRVSRPRGAAPLKLKETSRLITSHIVQLSYRETQLKKLWCDSEMLTDKVIFYSFIHVMFSDVCWLPSSLIDKQLDI